MILTQYEIEIEKNCLFIIICNLKRYILFWMPKKLTMVEKNLHKKVATYISRWSLKKILSNDCNMASKFTKCHKILLSLSGIDRFAMWWENPLVDAAAEWLQLAGNIQKLVQLCRIIIPESELPAYMKETWSGCIFVSDKKQIISDLFKFWYAVLEFFVDHSVPQNPVTTILNSLLRLIALLTSSLLTTHAQIE